tara:strand:+ start:324 stop:437 length:114 start_codon:yes stop_codon:yes gene_type:complete
VEHGHPQGHGKGKGEREGSKYEIVVGMGTEIDGLERN